MALLSLRKKWTCSSVYKVKKIKRKVVIVYEPGEVIYHKIWF
ncbi:MAG: hypothetical protein NZ583_06305 [Desulfobacterota bacterium]|nr:hypothetical protein [Thermodesulfobacteriota bacterium]MDW8002511.1 hypothetical protein [Deltaproteobacteria bacterium]